MAGFQLPFGVKPVNAVPVDYYSGPYISVISIEDAIEQANLAIPQGIRFKTMEVRLIVNGIGAKYWYRDGVTNTDLVEFTTSTSFYLQGGTTYSSDTTSNIYRTGSVNIGSNATSSSDAKLYVSSNQTGAFRLEDGTQGNGYVLTSDTNGVATWIDSNDLSIKGSSYVYVRANGTDLENATELQAAYDLAKTMSPTASNRITVIAAPGNYDFEDTTFVMDTEYIDLVSLDGNSSVVLNATSWYGIFVNANDVFVKGISVGSKGFFLGSNLNLLKIENCKGGDHSFKGNDDTSGTFINCKGGDVSFGSWTAVPGIASGVFIDCVGGAYSFGSSLSGGEASGTFINCIGGAGSFGFYGYASGDFTNCIGDGSCFAGQGIASGTFNYCIAGLESFGSGNLASGIFTNCVGGEGSFTGGAYGGALTGKLYYCRTSGFFNTVSSGGRTYYCVDGSGNTNNQ
jgi:hypothetical protein